MKPLLTQGTLLFAIACWCTADVPSQEVGSPQEDAEEILRSALISAKSENKAVFVHLSTPTCYWCRVLEQFLEEHSRILRQDFILTKIDTVSMTNGRAVADRLRKGREGGIPWMVILDGEGLELSSSDGPAGNIGYPMQPLAITYFVKKMIGANATRIGTREIADLESALKTYSDEYFKDLHKPHIDFEKTAKSLRAGAVAGDVRRSLGGTSVLFSGGAADNFIAFIPYFREKAWYCGYLALRTDTGIRDPERVPSSRVEIYRLPIPPQDYSPRTKFGKKMASREKGVESWRAGFVYDVFDVLRGEAEEDLGIEIELIHRQPERR